MITYSHLELIIAFSREALFSIHTKGFVSSVQCRECLGSVKNIIVENMNQNPSYRIQPQQILAPM